MSKIPAHARLGRPSHVRLGRSWLVVLLLAGAYALPSFAGPGTVLVSAAKATSADPFLMVRSPYSLEQTVVRIKAAAIGHNFRFIREQSLDYGFVSERDENTRQRIIYFCDFSFLHDALRIDRHIGIFLPCQVTVTERGDSVYIVALNPKIISAAFFNNPALSNACNILQQAYVEIIDEATM